MKRLIETAFPHCITNSCIEQETSTIIQIHDDEVLGRSCIHRTPAVLQYPKFIIKNPAGKLIYFLAIDNCILFSHDGEKCDFAVFDDKVFSFVEIKKGGGSHLNKTQKKNTALDQLRATLAIFLPLIDFRRYRVMACISVGYFTQSPVASAQDLNLLVEFINNYNVELIEGNEIEFR